MASENAITDGGEDGAFQCEICDVKMTTQVGHDAHINGFKHKKRVELRQMFEELKAANTPAAKVKTEFACEICQVYCPTQVMLDAHLEGPRHKKVR